MALFEIAGVRKKIKLNSAVTHRGPGLEISLILKLNVSQPLLLWRQRNKTDNSKPDPKSRFDKTERVERNFSYETLDCSLMSV
jgi:hypothetical protein